MKETVYKCKDTTCPIFNLHLCFFPFVLLFIPKWVQQAYIDGASVRFFTRIKKVPVGGNVPSCCPLLFYFLSF